VLSPQIISVLCFLSSKRHSPDSVLLAVLFFN
jgi:hypothetical protein